MAGVGRHAGDRPDSAQAGSPGGGAFTASWYAGDDFFPGGGTKNANRPRFRLIGHGGKLAHGSQKESVLLERLQQIRIELVKRTGKRG